MPNPSINTLRDASIVTLSLLSCQLGQSVAEANPTGGTVASGTASFNTSGSQFTITTSANAYINWQSFNIGAGETTTFLQPSTTSVVWNQINDSNPSQILGNLNANGYVILQNQSGFVVGGAAAISTHGLVLSTAPPMPSVAGSGAWQFNTPPPTAKIINFGQIKIIGGGSAFLIADDIENNGTISAASGKIGLYAGEKVLVSMSPDGRGLSAAVTLPQGSVDNEGKLIADGGSIVAQAQTVNQNGLAQANAVKNVNGTIEFVAGDGLTLGSQADIEANGAGAGSTVSLQAANALTVNAGAQVNSAAGSISVTGTTVNENGTLITKAVNQANGSIQVNASGDLSLGATADVEANGTAPGSAVSLQAGGTLSTAAGSTVKTAAGKINLTAATLNQDGTLQANAVNKFNGAIQLSASGNLDIGAQADLEANGTSAGSTVSLQANNTLTVEGGSVVNAAAGNIQLNGATVNQNGTLQANTVNLATGTIGITASGSLNLGAQSDLEANGANSGVSAGGSVNLQSANAFTDQAGSVINATGGAHGGAGGQIAISAPQMTSLQSGIQAGAAAGFFDGTLTLASENILVNGNGAPSTGDLALNTSALSSGFSQVNLQAANNLEVSTAWTLAPKDGQLNILSLVAGNAITVDDTDGIRADGGKVVLSAPTVNENGTLQANSVGNINGVVEVDASDNLNLGADAVLSAAGDTSSSSASPGGFVVLQSGNNYSDTASSSINVTGQNGGQDGIVEIFANGPVQASIGNNFATLINPYDLTLSYDSTDPNAPNINISDLASYSQIDLHAQNNIELQGEWFTVDPKSAALLSLQAGNNITLDDGTGIYGDNNWNISLVAGAAFTPTAGHPKPAANSDGIYLEGSAYIQTMNGNINVSAANEVQVATDGSDILGFSGIRTINGGNVSVNATYGDVNSGGNSLGYNFTGDSELYTVASDYGSALGGISTAAGGNVTINAGGNVISYLPSGNTSVAAGDAGSGAFGPEPGSVTIHAGGSVFGHYVLANGVGSITAEKNAGAANGNPFALSLINGGWTVNAPQGNIFLQEVRNPNGDFDGTGPGSFLFDYAPDASVTLNAIGVFLTGNLGSIPRPNGNVPVLYPSILNVNAGSGGLTLEGNVTLFPSADQSIDINVTDGGNFIGLPLAGGSTVQLLMSDSASQSWDGPNSFGNLDHGSKPLTVDDPNPTIINVDGNMENLNVITTEASSITVGGDMKECSFSGENLHSGDTTRITVAGTISDQSAYTFVSGVTIPALPATDVPPGYHNTWDSIFTLALSPTAIANLILPPGLPASQWASYAIENAHLFSIGMVSGRPVGVNPGFTYDAATGTLGFGGPMTTQVASALSGTVTVLRIGANGLPVTQTVKNPDGTTTTRFVTDTINWAPPTAIATLAQNSVNDPSPTSGQVGYRIGGPGEFDITAGSISLGNSYGILSCGVEDPQGGFNRYANLANLTPEAADLNVTVSGDLDMLTSTIAVIGQGGNLDLTSTGGSMELGSEVLFNQVRQVGYGVFTSGGGDVNVTALDDINIDGSRIATYNGGDIQVQSLKGNVDVGSTGANFTGVAMTYVDPTTGKAALYAEDVYGSGVVANTLVPASKKGQAFPPNSAALPGDISIFTPQGNVTSSLGGITQEALDGNIAGGPTINIVAGTFAVDVPGSPDYVPAVTGNIELGNAGVIGGTVDLAANGNIDANIISRQNSNVTAADNFSGSVLAAGSANVAGGGSVAGVIVGVTGANVSGGSGVTADVLGQNVSVNGGAAESTLGTSVGATAASQSAAQQASSDTKQLASADTNPDDDKKKKKNQPLMQRVKRVTVILPKKT